MFTLGQPKEFLIIATESLPAPLRLVGVEHFRYLVITSSVVFSWGQPNESAILVSFFPLNYL